MELQERNRNLLVKIPAFAFLGIVLVTLVVVLGLFHIRQVDVVGNEFYSAEEIQRMVMSGSLSENALYLNWKYSDPAAAEELPFLSAVEVSLISPYHVQIRVYEKTIAGYLMYSGSMVYFDKDGRVVEISQEKRDGIPPFSGLEIGQPVVKEMLPLNDEGFLDDLISEAQMISQSGLSPREVHYDENNRLILYFDRNRVLLGDNSYMEEKLSNLKALMPQMESLNGTLHMEDFTAGTRTITFKKGEEGDEELILDVFGPEGEEEFETETETETEEKAQSSGGYVEDPGRITTDAEGNQIYTDPAGNVTYNLDKIYLGDDGQVVSDGYGYIDPYTGAYFVNE